MKTPMTALALILLLAPAAHAEKTLIAVAANFTAAAKEIGTAFETATGHHAVFAFGSTGQLYAQITQGAPFDAFLAADQERPEKAEAEGFSTPGTRFTYAVGKLALWSADPAFATGPEALTSPALQRLAITNPRTAPYGAAAVETIAALGLTEALASRLVEGRTVAQTREFAASGAAQAGFVAWAQIALDGAGSHWLVPQEMHAAIAQDAALLGHGADNPAAAAFLDFLASPEAAAIIERHGYGVPARD